MYLYKTLLVLALALLMASAASAQSASGAKHRRYDPARPVYHDPYFRRFYRNHHDSYRHGRHHHHNGKHYAEQAGLPHIKPHDFRRWVGTQLTERYGLRVAQLALGHASPETTAWFYVLDELEGGLTDGLY